MKYTTEQIQAKYLADLQKIVDQELAEDAKDILFLQKIGKLPVELTPISRFQDLLSNGAWSFDTNLAYFRFAWPAELTSADMNNFGKSAVVRIPPSVSVHDSFSLLVTILLLDEYDDEEQRMTENELRTALALLETEGKHASKYFSVRDLRSDSGPNYYFGLDSGYIPGELYKQRDCAYLRLDFQSKEAMLQTWMESIHNGDSYDTKWENLDWAVALQAIDPIVNDELLARELRLIEHEEAKRLQDELQLRAKSRVAEKIKQK